jgi:microcystin-dependent protein
MNGAMLAFVPHTTNSAGCTLNVDGLGAKALAFGPNFFLQSGVLIQGTPYVASYNNADQNWYLQGGFANPYGIPLGGMMPYIGSSTPSSAFVLPFGQAISRTIYATLFSLAGTTFGAGDGSTTFNVPDLRGRSVFGLDNMGGSAAGRVTSGNSGITGTTLGAAGGDERLHQHSHGVTDPGHLHNYIVRNNLVTTSSGGQVNTWQTDNGTGNTSVATTGITVNNAGAGASQNMPPAVILPYILRVI